MKRLPSTQAINRAYTRESIREAHRDVPEGLLRLGAIGCTMAEADRAMRALRARMASTPGVVVVKGKKDRRD